MNKSKTTTDELYAEIKRLRETNKELHDALQQIMEGIFHGNPEWIGMETFMTFTNMEKYKQILLKAEGR
jgi:uncharacterized coiled-coil DUF342 family protein